MRVLVAHPGPGFSVADVHRGWVKALRKVTDCYSYNLDDRLAFYAGLEYDGKKLPEAHAAQLASRGIEAACYEWWPDVIVVVSGFFLPGRTYELWKHRPHKVVLLFTESPYEDDRQLNTALAADPALVILNDPTNIDRYRDVLGDRVVYIPHAYDPDIHYPKPAPLRYDFAFVGTGYPSRIEFFEQIDWSDINMTLAGHWKGLHNRSPLRKRVMHDLEECYDNADAVDLYRQSKMSANLYRAARFVGLEANKPELAEGWSVGPREVELAACATFFARETRGEGDKLFPMLPTFTEPAELEQIIRWYCSHDDERNAAAVEARAAVQDRTFDANVVRMLQLLTP